MVFALIAVLAGLSSTPGAIGFQTPIYHSGGSEKAVAAVDAQAHVTRMLSKRAEAPPHVADDPLLDAAVGGKPTWFESSDGGIIGDGHGSNMTEEEIEAAKALEESVNITPAPAKWLRTKPLHIKLPTAAIEKVKRLAKLVLDVTHQRNDAPFVLTGGRARAEKDRTAAQDVLSRTFKNDKFTVMELEDLVEMAAQSQSAESAEANDALVTATHLSAMLRGFRGEDYGTNYNYESDTPSHMVTYQGDIIKENDVQPWTDGVVKYCFADDVPTRIRHVFGKAVSHYQTAMPCLSFEDVGVLKGNSTSNRNWQECTESPAIYVTSNDDYGCYAHRGMRKTMTSQSLQLHDPGCALVGTVIHMLGHSLGLGHEHFAGSTHVRNKWVRNGRTRNFDRFGDSPGEKVGHNPLSIMHLDPYAFAQDPRRPTLEGPDVSKMGQRVALAASDVDRLIALYKPENSGCNESAFDGIGCYNEPTHQDSCPSLASHVAWCSSAKFKNCCACGGGTKVQCYKEMGGTDCPRIRVGMTLSTMRIISFFAAIAGLALSLVCVFGAASKLHAKLASQPVAGAAVESNQCGGKSDALGAKLNDGSAGKHASYGAIGNDVGQSGQPPREPAASRPDLAARREAQGTVGAAPAAGYAAAPVSEGLLDQTDRAPASRLSTEAFERFQGEFAPYAGGFSSGRSAPPAELVSATVAGTDNGDGATEGAAENSKGDDEAELASLEKKGEPHAVVSSSTYA